MNDLYKFQVIEDNLHWDFDIKGLKASNSIYDVNIMYYGNYSLDVSKNQVDRHTTIVSIKQNGLYPEIQYLVGYLYISIPHGKLFSIYRATEHKKNWEIATESAIALAELLKEYGFPVQLDDRIEFE